MTKFPRDKLVLFEGIALIIFTIMKINVCNYHYNDIYIGNKEGIFYKFLPH